MYPWFTSDLLFLTFYVFGSSNIPVSIAPGQFLLAWVFPSRSVWCTSVWTCGRILPSPQTRWWLKVTHTLHQVPPKTQTHSTHQCITTDAYFVKWCKLCQLHIFSFPAGLWLPAWQVSNAPFSFQTRKSIVSTVYPQCYESIQHYQWKSIEMMHNRTRLPQNTPLHYTHNTESAVKPSTINLYRHE